MSVVKLNYVNVVGGAGRPIKTIVIMDGCRINEQINLDEWQKL